MQTFATASKPRIPDHGQTDRTPHGTGQNWRGQTPAIRHLLHGSALQPKLTVGAPHDAYEREADRVAEEVMGLSDEEVQTTAAPPRLQRLCSECEEELSTKPADSGSSPAAAVPAIVHEVLRSPGRPLEAETRAFFEPRFGRDFGDVRIHTDVAAAESARAVNALAYTVGRNLVLGAGQYAPFSEKGGKLLAHELTHLVQQTAGGEIVRRQAEGTEADEDELIDTGEVEPSSTVNRPPPEFGDQAVEPGCPPAPTNLGKLQPDPPCPGSSEDLSGSLFQFCLDSDVFINQSQIEWLRAFARRQRADSIFKVHGYASTDGDTAYNLNLSCHRAKRAARELQNAGVPSHRIQIAARGETRLFGSRQADNRVALVHAEAPGDQTTPSFTGEPVNDRDAVDRAVARILARDYRLAADAYLARWTCGTIPNAAELVRRLTIKIQGEAPNDLRPTRMGLATSRGRNEIWLGEAMFREASDPVLCAIARILDLGFHHAVHDSLGVPPEDQGALHSAAVFFVELAGIPPCETPGTPNPLDPSQMVDPARPWWTAPTTDPLAAVPAPCPGQVLPGPIDPQRQPARPIPPPTFNVSDFRTEVGEANTQPEIHSTTNRLTMRSARRAIGLDAQVTATGDPAEIARYRIGFLQTVTGDSLLAEYVSGQVVERQVPVPLRDRAPDDADSPPWFRPSSTANGIAGAATSTELTASPTAEVELAFENFERRGRLARGEGLVQANNPLNRATLRRTYNTWLVARREDAPLDRFSTQFLAGRQVDLTLDADVLGEHATGHYRSDIEATPLGDPTRMQLAGPTPEEIAPDWRIVGVHPPTPRAAAPNTADLDEIRRQVRDLADKLVPLRQALHLDGPIMVRVRFDRQSGRLILDTPERPAVTVEETGPEEDRVGVSVTGRRELAQAFLIRLRKDLVAAPGVPDISQGIPTALMLLPSFTERRRRQRGRDPNPFAPEHGLGLLGHLREEGELARSDRQLQDHPDVYDPTFWPRVQVRMGQELYCFDFRVSGVDISETCVDPTMHTEGCVRPFLPADFTLRANPTFRDQQLGGETFHSPVALRVTTFPIRFVMFTPRESPGGDTFNHEMHHLIDSFNLVQSLKDRLARRIRARLLEIRRLAADNPPLRDSLLSHGTISEIVQQENQAFMAFFRQQFLALGGEQHRREAAEGLPPYRTRLPPSWTDFREPPLHGGTQGSFTSTPCR